MMPYYLMILSAIVCVGLILRKNMWPFVVVYWFVLTMKNMLDWLETLRP